MANYNPYGYPYQPYQQMQQGYPQQQSTQPQIVCRPVASIDEARAIPTDFSGNVQIFPDLAHGCIYTKALNYQTGAAELNVYRLYSEPAQNPPEYITKGEFLGLKTVVDRLIEQLGGLDDGK